jgi:acyl-CoA synthetase
MTATADDILRHLDEAGLSKFDMPEYFLPTSDIPLTTSGKILKRELVSRAADGRIRPQPVRWQAEPARRERA